MGFMGLFPFFLSVTIPDVSLMQIHQVDGLTWGDIQGRYISVKNRQIRVCAQALKLFYTNIEPISPRSFVELFQLDDDFLNSDHITEYWY